MRVAAIFLISVLFATHASFGQAQDEDGDMSDREKIIIFGGFAAAVIGLALFLARDVILRRKTSYDTEEMESKRDRTREKYHSDWGDEYEEIGTRRNTLRDKEFREAAQDGELPDYYDILGVSRDATPDEIKKRFRELAKQTHPDRTGGDSEEEMSMINKAYEVLSDDEGRERYDRYLAG